MADVGALLPIIPWEEITLDTKLGEGGFGVVFKGNWKYGGSVAIKQIKGILGADAMQELRAEAGVMASLNSPYIIRLFGLCWEEQRYAMVMELMPKASLYDLLHNGQPLPWNIRYQIAQDIAYGLRLLHARHILHRDLKSLNVLLDDRLRAKLTDFGLAKVKSNSRSTTKASDESVGTIAWMAPELFSLSPKYTESSDTYAYGMVGLELATRDIPYKDVADYNIIKDAVKSGERAEIPDDCPATFTELIKSCWAQDARKRPTMEVVVDILERAIKIEGYVYEVAQEQARASVYQDVTSSLGAVTQGEAAKPIFAIPSQSDVAEYELGCRLYGDGKRREALNYFLKISSDEAHPYYLAVCLKLWGIYSNGIDVSFDQEKSEYYAKIISAKIGWFLRQADSGDPDSQYNLGQLYSAGIGVPKDYSQACVWFEKAAAQGLAMAQFRLGVLYYNGQGVDQNYDQARVWFEKAAAQGHAMSQYNLGTQYKHGEGVRQDHDQARYWIEKAAKQGQPNAQANLGLMYKRGEGIAQDYDEARTWFEKAASQNNDGAQCQLGFMYYFGQGVAQDYVKAREWFEKAALQGLDGAQRALGNLYYNGEGGSQDYAKAREWYEAAAAQGHADAQQSLGFMYVTGQGMRQDHEQARFWFEKAAMQGNVMAQNNLGLLYKNSQDYAKARFWFEKAAAQGNADAKVDLGLLYRDGEGVRQDYDLARAWFEKAAAQGNARGQHGLGCLYLKGLGVRQDYSQAIAWIEKAAAQGLGVAVNNLPSIKKALKEKSTSCRIM